MTTGALTEYVQKRKQGGVDIPTTVRLLGRYAFLEKCAIRALAGWFLRIPAFEDKIASGYQLWGHTERVTALRTRLHELRGGHREANIEPVLKEAGEALLHAPDDDAFLAGMLALVENLIACYREHLQDGDPSANAQDLRVIRRGLNDLESDSNWLLARRKELSKNHWYGHLQSLLARAGGVSGLESAPSDAQPLPLTLFRRPETLIFDRRIQQRPMQSYKTRMDLPFDEKRISEFKIFFNEFYAAAMLATILYDSWTLELPWEFFHDIGHHFWDEVRHAEFGLRRLRELGAEPGEVNLLVFERAQQMPVLQRLCYLTLDLEVYFMPRKQPRVKRYEEAGDHRSQLFADVDWSDEGNHVQYGHRWVNHLLENDSRSVADLRKEIDEFMAPVLTGLGPGEKVPY